MQISLDNLQKMINEKYISVQKHPTAELYIYNYTQKAQFGKVWNNETLQCRGLILNKDNEIVARPFKKFFNLQEILDQGGQIPAEDFIVTEKMDGSLGILYFVAGMPFVATRGSFISEQAQKASEMIQNIYINNGPLFFKDTCTYLFEIIYPQNRIVVNYGDTENLILLSVIDNETGEEWEYDEMRWMYKKYLTVVKKYDGINDFSHLESRENAEGYVVFFPSSKQRFKIKFDEYVRLHRLVTGVNARRIWDLLRNNESFDELLERVPDEFYAWVKKTKQNLEEEFALVKRICLHHYEIVRTLPTRKDQAIAIFKHKKEYSGIIFAMLDKKPYEEMIWKMLKPKAEKPFKEEI